MAARVKVTGLRIQFLLWPPILEHRIESRKKGDFGRFFCVYCLPFLHSNSSYSFKSFNTESYLVIQIPQLFLSSIIAISLQRDIAITR
jgi:hypothetical protein